MTDKTIDLRPLAKTFKTAAFVSATFAAVLAVLLALNFIQIRANNPLSSPALAALSEKLGSDKSDEALKEQIRELDLVARKAFFTKQWQIQASGILLFVSVTIALVFLRLAYYAEKKRAGAGGRTEKEDPIKSESRKRTAVMVLMIFLFSTSIAIGLASYAALDEESLDKRLAAVKASGDTTKSGGATEEEMARNWPSFRGPFGDGRIPDPNRAFAQARVSEFVVIWKKEVPKNGFNSPIVWNDRIFFTGSDKESIGIYCVSAEDGSAVWKADLSKILGKSPTLPKDVDSHAGYVAPTMTTDGEKVFAMFASGDLVALDPEGNALWKREFGLPDNAYGHASSLVCYGNRLIVQLDNYSDSRLYALDTATGKNAWEKRREVLASWSSPVLVRADGRIQIVTNGNPNAIAYGLDNGDELWSAESGSSDIATSPAFADGIAYVANQYARLVAIDWKTGAILWEAYDDLPSVSSPVANDEYVFVATDYGVVSCYESEKGGLLWTHEFENGFYSSLVLAGDTLLLADMGGTLHFIKADKAYTEIGSVDVREKIVCTPAIKDGLIYLRGESNLYCIGTGN